MPTRNVCVLSDNLAVVSGIGRRYKKDGSMLTELGWTHTVIRTSDGWRIASTFTHDKSNVVRCAS